MRKASSAALHQIVFALGWLRDLLLRQKWFNSRVMPAIPRQLRWTLRRLYFIPFDLVESALGQSEEMIPPKSKVFVGTVDFKEGAEDGVNRLHRFGVLTPESHVLDIGCGIGRLAVPMTRYLRGGSYHGLDVVPSGIEWCNQHIASRHPNFHFTLADVFNGEYNPKGRTAASEYTFPYPDDQFDLVILASVFTHMQPEDTEQYVREIARVLRKGGHCWASCYLLNPDSVRMMETREGSLCFRHNHGTYWTVNPKCPELSIGYDEHYILDLFDRNGLSLADGVYYGRWCGRPLVSANSPGPDEGADDQDLLLATKT